MQANTPRNNADILLRIAKYVSRRFVLRSIITGQCAFPMKYIWYTLTLGLIAIAFIVLQMYLATHDCNPVQSEPWLLHCSTDAQPRSNAAFGQGTGPIFLNNVVCGTTQNRLIDCTFDMNTAGRTHADDAGVICSTAREWNELCKRGGTICCEIYWVSHSSNSTFKAFLWLPIYQWWQNSKRMCASYHTLALSSGDCSVSAVLRQVWIIVYDTNSICWYY